MCELDIEAKAVENAALLGQFEGFHLVDEGPTNSLIGRPWTIAGSLSTQEGFATNLLPGDVIHYDTECNWISIIRDGQPLKIVSLIDGEQRGLLKYLRFSHVVVKPVFVATIAIISAVTGLTFRKLDKPGFTGVAYRVFDTKEHAPN